MPFRSCDQNQGFLFPPQLNGWGASQKFHLIQYPSRAGGILYPSAVGICWVRPVSSRESQNPAERIVVSVAETASESPQDDGEDTAEDTTEAVVRDRRRT
jgi:hypothetical protein